jgi:hypothetical protein
METQLQTEAVRKRLSLDQYVAQVLDEHVSQAKLERKQELTALVQSWIDDTEADDDEYWDEEFYQHLDAERPEGSKLFPPELKGISW